MNTYVWDSGVFIGFVVWCGPKFQKVTSQIDWLAPHCDRFVYNEAKNCSNIMPGNAKGEIKNRLTKNNLTFSALVDLIKTNKFTPNSYVDSKRLLDLNAKLSKLPKEDSIIALIEIQSSIQTRSVLLNNLCKFKDSYKRIPSKEEQKIKNKFLKDGDLSNYSVAIAYNNDIKECFFITTDYKDFGSLDFSDVTLPYKFPTIRFVKDY